MGDLRVIGDRILVRRITGKEHATAGGIIMPTVSKEGGRDTQWGTVLAVGEGTYDPAGIRRPVSVREGDEVAFGYHVGWFVSEADELLVIAERDVVAVRPAALPAVWDGMVACHGGCGAAVALPLQPDDGRDNPEQWLGIAGRVWCPRCRAGKQPPRWRDAPGSVGHG